MSKKLGKGITPPLLSVVVAVGLLGAAGNTLAAPTCPETLDPQADYKCVFIDLGVDKDGSGSSKTDAFYELGITGTLATSIYGFNASGTIGVGSAITDTNRKSVMNSFGFVGGSGTTYSSLATLLSLPGGPHPAVSINDTSTNSQKNVDSLNDVDPTEPPASTNGLNVASTGWRLYYDYVFTGTLTASGPKFTGGDLIVYYDDLTTAALDDTKVLRVNITGSKLNASNLDLFGLVTFDFDDNGTNDCTTTFCQNFWNFQSGPEAWYVAGNDPLGITFHLDTNVNPPIPTAQSLGVGAAVDGVRYAARQTTLDSSVRFNEIPEPTSLALFGVALLGLVASSRRSRQV